VIRNPQHVVAARLDTVSTSPVIAVEERGSVDGPRTFVIDGGGRITSVIADHFMPMQNRTAGTRSSSGVRASSWSAGSPAEPGHVEPARHGAGAAGALSRA
jgi:hypothetical protein